jgi:hypothetical protein
MTASPCTTSCTINDPAGVAGNGVLTSNFTVNGDFTAGVTQSGGMNGSPEFDVGFEVGFAGGNLTNQFVRFNSFGQPVPPLWGGSLNFPSGPPVVFGDAFLTGLASAHLDLQRIGDTVNLFYNNTLIASDTGPNYLGAATIFLVASSSASGGGSATWDNLTVDSPSAVPGPVAGAGLPGLIFLSGVLLAWRKKRKGVAPLEA